MPPMSANQAARYQTTPIMEGRQVFRITLRKGFQITFANGWTASVQWGYGNYCDAKSYINGDYNRTTDAESKTAEVAAWDANGNWYNFGTDTVKGYMTPNEVLAFLNMVATFDTTGPTVEA